MLRKTRFIELKNTFRKLHGPKGCLWDKRQTYKTLIPHLREEVREFISAVESGNYRHMEEELGDILLHVMFYSQIASKEKKFNIEGVIGGLIKKLKRRHPHVFGKVKMKSARQIILSWNKIKSAEKAKERKPAPGAALLLPED